MTSLCGEICAPVQAAALTERKLQARQRPVRSGAVAHFVDGADVIGEEVGEDGGAAGCRGLRTNVVHAVTGVQPMGDHVFHTLEMPVLHSPRNDDHVVGSAAVAVCVLQAGQVATSAG